MELSGRALGLHTSGRGGETLRAHKSPSSASAGEGLVCAANQRGLGESGQFSDSLRIDDGQSSPVQRARDGVQIVVKQFCVHVQGERRGLVTEHSLHSLHVCAR